MTTERDDIPLVDMIWHKPADKLPPIQQAVPVRLKDSLTPLKGLWSYRGYWIVQIGDTMKRMERDSVECWLETTAREMGP